MQEQEHQFSFRSLFVPFTTIKAIHWIVIIGIAVFANMLFNGFVWDDKTYFINNLAFPKLNFIEIFKPNIFNYVGQYRPIPALYYWVLHSIFGSVAFFYHIPQLILHITNSILVFYLFKHFLDKKFAFFLSVIFLVHPIQVESVSYIASFDNPLFFFFGIIGLLLSFKKEIDIKRGCILFGLLLLSLLTKETGVLFLALFVGYRFLFKKGKLTIFIFSGIATIVLYCLIRFGIGGAFLEKLYLLGLGRLSLTGRLINIPSMLSYYLSTFFFPSNLVIEQIWVVTKLTFTQFFLPLCIEIGLGLLSIFFGLKLFSKNKEIYKSYVFFCFWFAIGMLLHLQIFPLDLTVADRWFYFPMVGLLGMIGVTLQSLKLSKDFIKQIGYTVAVIIILILSLRTMVRNTNWVDGVTLYTHDLKTYDNFDMENNLAVEYSNQQQYALAVFHLQKSIALFPHEGNLYDLGVIYGQMGENEKAMHYFVQALHAKNYYYSTVAHTHNLVTYTTLAWFLIRNGSYNDAQTIIHDASEEYPNDPLLLEETALCQYYLHNQDKAIETIQKAILISPNQEFNLLLSKMENHDPITLAPFPTDANL